MSPDVEPFADDELARLGGRVRADAAPRTGDLADLIGRSRAARQRSRGALIGVLGVAVIVAVVLGLTRVGPSTDSLQVGDGTGGIASDSPDAVPSWTVNPSIPVPEDAGEVWAIEVVYDPLASDFGRLVEAPGPAPMMSRSAALIGVTSSSREPRVQAYWIGDGAQRAAEETRASLLGQPGIVSVEVRKAEPTTRPPRTAVPDTGPPHPGPTVVTLVRPVLSDPRPTQDEIFADGVVTDEEYELALWTFVECAEADGASFSSVGRFADGRYQYTMSTGGAGDACYRSIFMQVDLTWQLQREAAGPASGPTVTGR